MNQTHVLTLEDHALKIDKEEEKGGHDARVEKVDSADTSRKTPVLNLRI